MKVALGELKEHETVLIYGKPKVGKSFSYCSVVERCVKAGGKVFILNTDSGVKRTMTDYFGEQFNDIAQHIEYYLITSLEGIEDIIADVKKHATPNDLLIIDLLSDFWEMAQQKFIENLSGGKLADYYERASRDKAKFGLLSGQQWQYVKALDSLIINELVVRPPCTVVAVCTSKEIEMDRLHNNKQVVERYEVVNEKPGGSRDLQYKFNTIVYVGERKSSKFFYVIGDRGKYISGERIPFKKDFWGTFTEYRERTQT